MKGLCPFAVLVLSLSLLAACSQTSVPEAPNITPLDEPSRLYAQLDNATNVFVGGGQDLSDGFQPECYVADEFIVPTGETWEISEVGLVGDPARFADTSKFPPYTIAFFGANTDGPNFPGEPISKQTYTLDDLSGDVSLWRIPLSNPVELTAGTYWVGIDGWFVNVRTPPTGYPAVRGREGDFSEIDLGGFGGITEPVDLTFALFGNSYSAEPPVITLDKFGAIHEDAGVATVSGTVTCAAPETLILQVALEQQRGKQLVKGTEDISVECDGETPWEADVAASSGSFKPGLAHATAGIAGADAAGQAVRSINLRWFHPHCNSVVFSQC